MIVFHVGRCQWIVRFLPYAVYFARDEDGDMTATFCRQWGLGRWTVPRGPASWFNGKPTVVCWTFGPIELRRFSEPLKDLVDRIPGSKGPPP